MLRTNFGCFKGILGPILLFCGQFTWASVQGPLAACNGPTDLLLAEAKNTSGMIGIFVLDFNLLKPELCDHLVTLKVLTMSAMLAT